MYQHWKGHIIVQDPGCRTAERRAGKKHKERDSHAHMQSESGLQNGLPESSSPVPKEVELVA
jgi:hypothetical protein